MTGDVLRVWTIGHSNHSLEQFVDLLVNHAIEILVDIRRFPGSRKFPHFRQESLSESLKQIGIEYHWLQGLGGRRGVSNPSTGNNDAWQNNSFRNYADYMQTEEFRAAFQELQRLAGDGRTTIMCSESVYWRCHRRLVSDFVTASGGDAEHIFPDGRTKRHKLTDTAVVQSVSPVIITYPGEPTLFD